MNSTPAPRPRRDDAVLQQINTSQDQPLLLTGGTVITQNPLMGDWQNADVLIGGEVIVGVGPGLITAAEDDGMIVIDCAGTVVLPAAFDLTGDGTAGTLTPGEHADIAVFGLADAPDAPKVAAPSRGSHLDLLFAEGRLLLWGGHEVETSPSQVRNPDPTHDPDHPYTGMWSTDDQFLRQELSADGRYDEARGDRKSAYTGSYWIDGSRIDYLDDLGFWAFGEFHDGVLHHAGYQLTRR